MWHKTVETWTLIFNIVRLSTRQHCRPMVRIFKDITKGSMILIIWLTYFYRAETQYHLTFFCNTDSDFGRPARTKFGWWSSKTLLMSSMILTISLTYFLRAVAQYRLTFCCYTDSDCGCRRRGINSDCGPRIGGTEIDTEDLPQTQSKLF